MSRRKKKVSPVGVIVLTILLALLALLIVFRYTSEGPEKLLGNSSSETGAPDTAATTDPTQEASAPDNTAADETAATPAAYETPAPTAPEPTAAPTETPAPPMVLENEGNLEFIIPDDMESDGF